MNDTLKAVIVQVSGGNVRNHHINLRGAFGLFPDDSFGGNNGSAAAKPVSVSLNGETVETDIDEAKAIFRERGAIRRFFADQTVIEGDYVLIRRCGDREFEVSKVAKRIYNLYL